MDTVKRPESPGESLPSVVQVLGIRVSSASIVDYVAAAIRRADGDHTMGAGRLAEVAIAAVFEFGRTHAPSVVDACQPTGYLPTDDRW